MFSTDVHNDEDERQFISKESEFFDLEKFVTVEAKLKTILATLSSHLLWSFKKICLVVHNSVSKTANQSASFQVLDDHEPNTYTFLANQSA